MDRYLVNIKSVEDAQFIKDLAMQCNIRCEEIPLELAKKIEESILAEEKQKTN